MRKKLLIIEDDPDMSQLLKNKASELNYRCDVDSTGARWGKLIQSDRPSAILLDMDLPKMGGFSILRQLKSKDDWRSIPVFVWSGTSDAEVVDEAKALGAEAYFFKSRGFEDLFEKIRALS